MINKEDLLKQGLELIPAVGPYISLILEIGHKVFIAFACYQILHELTHGVKPQQA